MINRKGQSALEFLMTYGWTILAALVSLAAFWQFGIIGDNTLSLITGSAVCVLPPGGPICKEYSVSQAGVSLILANALPETITDVFVSIQSLEPGVICTSSDPENLPSIESDASKPFFVPCDGLSNKQRFKGNLKVSYKIAGKVLTHEDQGTIISGDITEQVYCVDGDGDGYGYPGSALCTNGAETDCNDGSAAAHPNNDPEDNCELCIDELDNDCENGADELDPNCDGKCVGNPLCIPDGDWDDDTIDGVLCGGDDCQDNDDSIHPPASFETTDEQCIYTIDNDCDSLIDNDDDSCPAHGGGTCNDEDNDGYGDPGLQICPNGKETDCNNLVTECGFYCFPNRPLGEICEDQWDNDCNEQTDESPCDCIDGCDIDNDGSCKENCEIGYTHPWPGEDCNDGDPNINWYTPEVCGDKIDNNCNEIIDENCKQGPCDPGCDADNDTYCSTECVDGNDCDDNDRLINPGVEGEQGQTMCTDLKDNDCNDLIDCNDDCCIGQGSSPIFSPLFKIACVEPYGYCGG